MSVPPPYYPYPLPSEAPEPGPEPKPEPGSAARPPRRRRRWRPRRRPRLRVPWVLVDDAFWTGVLTAVSIAGLVAVIVATT
ncbi:hypothetical protein [Streptomyces griseorubiginosus]|uniref:hypothetical protein n=1 Tax=Streptomyces griseorubiginosus TaxID=67304 RepID=UPI002E812B44|nr:hypothetical protein [Streptomyces griseorubiginosus]WUB46051.1 hypothetical protein OHN19_23030 [Streptomyces griseorubiginosus]WUB54572.1 hypothetical protein OG942_23030 [Streptomyces griseorubiginosus]